MEQTLNDNERRVFRKWIQVALIFAIVIIVILNYLGTLRHNADEQQIHAATLEQAQKRAARSALQRYGYPY